MAEILVETRGLAKQYRVAANVVHALRGIDLTLERGECLAVVGELGSGKTTLGNLVLGIERPSAGQIFIDGREAMTRRDRRLRRRIQVVQQNPMATLNPKRTILESVALPLKVHELVPRSAVKQRVAELLDLVGLSPDYMPRYPVALSGGQRQRVALARALAAEPDGIVLDEPTSSLDVSVQARVLELLVSLQKAVRAGLSFHHARSQRRAQYLVPSLRVISRARGGNGRDRAVLRQSAPSLFPDASVRDSRRQPRRAIGQARLALGRRTPGRGPRRR